MKILLRDIKEKRNLFLRQIENMTGVSKSALSRIIRGQSSPSMEEMEMLAKGLHIYIEDLYSSEFKKRPDIGTKVTTPK